ncbi:HEAT repeat domain-containing protein [Halocatena marina]|nr:HEAT repeat domain-containing protein [Halocatena marina]
MSNGDDDSEATTDATEASGATDTDPDVSETNESEEPTTDDDEPVTPEALSERLESIETDLESAETESDLDEIEARLDAVATDVEALPEPDADAEDEDDGDDDDDEEDPRVQLEERIEEIRDAIEEQRGPYASDVVETLDSVGVKIAETQWTEQGKSEVIEAVASFLEAANEALDSDFTIENESIESVTGTITNVMDATKSADLDPDDDAETIDTLLAASEELQNELEEAQEWSDLTVHQQLKQLGFYDELTSENRKDYPPELSVVRIAESENDPEKILLALDKLDSQFMQENCIDALCRMGPDAAFEEMNQRAQKRDKDSIEVLGKIGDDRALETVLPYIEGDTDPALQKVTLKAIGEIGSDEATQTVADRLVADEPEVRSAAARALGRIGDTRAIEPLSDLLADDGDDNVRASAAWSLNQIGTQSALERTREYTDDRSYIVQVEAERAAKATAEPETAL